MNFSFFSRFSKTRKTNAIFRLIDEMKHHPVFKKARFDVYSGSLHPQRLVILFGQVHTVWRGKIGNRERKMIAKCQARLCSYYAYLEHFHQVRAFGGEGLYDGLDVSFHDRQSFGLYREVESSLSIHHPVDINRLAEVAGQILEQLSKRWHLALRNGSSLEDIQRLAAAVSGQTLFNYLSSSAVKVFPIEGEEAYQKVLEGIQRLGDRIAQIEEKPSFRYVKQRQGKVKTEQEAQVVQQYNALVEEFNRLIGSDIRERATFEILQERAQRERLVVFTMGVGHRDHYLKLADEVFKESDVAFLFVTPPELLVNWWISLGVPLFVLLLLLFFGWYFGA